MSAFRDHAAAQRRPSPDGAPLARPGRVTAVLGPTNTGKTHLAIDRMLAHRSGMIGLPLRLLAREVYDKVVRVKGAAAVALITGEEKIVPLDARYFVCTVESMPLDLAVEFLAIDEVQLAADPERGHVFTDRLFHARGNAETMLLGAATMHGAIRRFVPQAQFTTRPRFSDLAYTGPRKLTRLPRRSAVVAFSAEDVYEIAELIRRQRGGAAVVLGALSPRTRNAQVALYQSGEVDFLIATDAIGMGLNMDVDHVAFAALDKFDGVAVRPLRAEEIGQIAGRAGRHMNDGTFGVTGDAEPLEPEIAERVETHRYDPVRVLQWRNANLDFSSLDALMASLDAAPPLRGLAKARPASDATSLYLLAGSPDICGFAQSPAGVRRLWEACQLPDFHKITAEEHARLVGAIYRHLMSDAGVLPADWLGRQIARLDRTEGDVHALAGRLAQIRTWTYAANRQGWTEDPAHWQEVTRGVEDRLSDALHERLTQRFIDRRTAVLLRGLRDGDAFHLDLDDSSGVSIGGEHVGKLDGFRFTPDPRAQGIHGRALRAAALKGLEAEITARARRLVRASDDEIALSDHGKLWWSGVIVGQLLGGAHALDPEVAVAADEHLRSELADSIRERLERWVAANTARRLAPLVALRAALARDARTADALPAAARGIAFQLCEQMGVVVRQAAVLPENSRSAIRALAPFGVRFGRLSIFLPRMLKPDAASLAALLWAVHARLERIPAPPSPGLTSFADESTLPDGFLAAAGFRRVGPRAIRVDMLERLESLLAKAATNGTPANTVSGQLVSLLGCNHATLAEVLSVLGWRERTVAKDEGASSVWRRDLRGAQSRRARHDNSRQRPKPSKTDSPFAGLAGLLSGK